MLRGKWVAFLPGSVIFSIGDILFAAEGEGNPPAAKRSL
jgi:hypothetical protein